MPGDVTGVRLAIVSQEFPPFSKYSGGIGAQHVILARALAAEGWEVHVLTAGDEEALHSPQTGLTVHTLPTRMPPGLATFGQLGWSWRVAARLRRLPAVDCVLAAEWAGEAWFYSWMRGRSRLITGLHTSLEQILATDPGHEPTGFRGRLAWSIQRKMERQQTRRSDALLAPSASVLQWATDLWGLRQPARVIPNLLDTEQTEAELARAARQVTTDPSDVVVAYVGRLEPRKGVEVLARAIPSVLSTCAEARFVFVGADGEINGVSMQEHIRNLVGASDRLEFLGPLQRPDTLLTMEAADIIVLPSLWENFPMVAIEAAIVGTTLLMSRTGGLPEMFSDNEAAFVRAGDEMDLATGLIRLLRNPADRQRLADAAAERVLQYDVHVVLPAFTAWLTRGGPRDRRA